MADETKEVEEKTSETQTEQGSDKKYSDEELNGIVAKSNSKTEQKLLKALGITDVEKAKSILKEAAEKEAKENDGTAEKDETLKKAVQRAVRAEVKNILAENGLTGNRAERMLGLINLKSCTDEQGEVNTENVNAEIEAVKKDFPELFNEEKETNLGFKIGSDGLQEELESIVKEPVQSKKRWNRFNY